MKATEIKNKAQDAQRHPKVLLFKDLIEIDELQNMLEVSYAATGMPSGIIDAVTGEIYAGAGWQRICVNFHRTHPEARKRCIASDTAITNKIQNGKHYGYKCANGIWDIGVPIMCYGNHIATFFLGQFFYEDEVPEKDFFIHQAEHFGFDRDDYLSALDEVPRFSKKKIETTLRYNVALAAFLSDLASQSMTLHMEIVHRKEMEKELRNLQSYLADIIDSMPSTIIGVDPEGKVTQLNRRAAESSGVLQSDALGRPLKEIVPEMRSDISRIKDAISSGHKMTYATNSKNQEGNQVYEDVTIYPLTARETEGAVIRIDDITERIKMERMLIQSEKMMSIGGLAAGMAHEINNPLAGILGQISNLNNRIYSDIPANTVAAEKCAVSLEDVRAYLNERQIPRMINSIQESGIRAANIVRNMLSFARKSESTFSSHNINELIDSTIEIASNDYNLKKKHDFKQFVIIRQYDPELPNMLCAGNEIQQVLLNIFKNGAEAMAENKYHDSAPTFICRTYSEENMAVIEIEDNGTGIDEQTRKRIFEPFFTTKGVGTGTGLGLSVSYFIITDQHGGSMNVESEPGSGTKFIMKLPFAITV